MSDQSATGTQGIYSILKWVAIGGALLWLGYEGYNLFAGRQPGDTAYLEANNIFKDGYYQRAADKYREALDQSPKHTPAMRGLANSYVQLKRYDQALIVIDQVIAIEPEFGGNYAIRGIINDHMKRYLEAIADYERALKLQPDVAEGMHWLDRLLYNVQDTPPTVQERLNYLKEQMKLPESERVLSVPGLDEKQRPYEQ